MAVIDLSRVSPNLLWEVRTCFRALPSERVILISSTDLADDVDTLVATIESAGVESRIVSVIPYTPKRPFKFATALHERMTSIYREGAG